MNEEKNIDKEKAIATETNRDSSQTFYDKAQAMSEAEWKKYCRIFGGLLGAAGGALLMVAPDTATFGDYKLLVVALGLLLLPRFIEGQAQRDVGPGRVAMIIAFAAMLAVALVHGLLTGGFN